MVAYTPSTWDDYIGKWTFHDHLRFALWCLPQLKVKKTKDLKLIIKEVEACLIKNSYNIDIVDRIAGTDCLSTNCISRKLARNLARTITRYSTYSFWLSQQVADSRGVNLETNHDAADEVMESYFSDFLVNGDNV